MTFTKQVFQDIVLPMTALEDSIKTSERLFDTYPILIYPCRIYDHGRKKMGQLRCKLIFIFILIELKWIPFYSDLREWISLRQELITVCSTI